MDSKKIISLLMEEDGEETFDFSHIPSVEAELKSEDGAVDETQGDATPETTEAPAGEEEKSWARPEAKTTRFLTIDKIPANKDLTALVKDQPFEKIPITKINDVLSKYNLEIATKMLKFIGRNGNQDLPLKTKSGAIVKNTKLVLYWSKDIRTQVYTIQAYLA